MRPPPPSPLFYPLSPLSFRGTSSCAAPIFLALLIFAGCKKSEEQQADKVTTEVAVQVGKLTRTNLHQYVTAYGTIEPEPAHDGQPGAGARLAPAAPGIVAEVMCVEGQHVEKGAALFRLDSRPVDVAIEFATQT